MSAVSREGVWTNQYKRQLVIQRVEVHQAEKIDGVHVQCLTIHYNCVGTLEIPQELPLDMPKVQMQTRKGVQVSYESIPVAL